MSTRWKMVMAALLGCVLAGAARAEKSQADNPKVGEAHATTGEPARDKSEGKSAKEPLKVGAPDTQFLEDAYGKPVVLQGERLLDSKGEQIPFSKVPLREVITCYPPPKKGVKNENIFKKLTPRQIPEGSKCFMFSAQACPAPYYPCSSGFVVHCCK